MDFKIDVFSDPVCPWCLLGLARLDKVLDGLPETDNVTILHHAFLLDASAPEEGENTYDMLTRKYGQKPDAVWERLEQEAKNVGMALDMRKQPTRYPTQAAHVLIQEAGRRGADMHAVERDIARANYLEARNISDPAVLDEIAQRHGFAAGEAGVLVSDPQRKSEIERAAQVASANGVSGVPLFVFNDKYALSGAQPESIFVEVFRRLRDEAA